MYLSTSELAMSAILVGEENRKQTFVYFVSHVLECLELNYPNIEKLALAVIMAIRKLRPYFEPHPINVLTN